jgi:hypothetical protein
VTPFRVICISVEYVGRLGGEMSSDSFNDPKHWLDRAAEMRAIAGPMAEDGIKASVLRMATDYDKLAARAIARTSGEAT